VQDPSWNGGASQQSCRRLTGTTGSSHSESCLRRTLSCSLSIAVRVLAFSCPRYGFLSASRTRGFSSCPQITTSWMSSYLKPACGQHWRRSVVIQPGLHSSEWRPTTLTPSWATSCHGPGMRGCLREIHRFVEKPAAQEARRLCQQGALWNSFILACRAQSLIELYRGRCPEIVQRLERVRSGDYTTLHEVYRELPQVDFSRQIATGQAKSFTVVPVPRCGWTDLRTLQRLAQAVARYIKPGAGMPEASWSTPGDRINLAERCMHGDGTRAYPYQSGGTQ
jgi:hypothetical protein